jgi:hypothetical protein
MNIKHIKSLAIAVCMGLLVVFAQPVLSLTTVLDDTANDPENVMDINDAGVTNWKTFEDKIFNIVKSSNPSAAQQVSLDVTHSGGTVTRIRPDVLAKVGTKYKVIDVKTSKVKDLGALPDLSVFCTSNQKIVYPLINKIATGNSTITKVVVKGTQGGALGLSDGTTIALEDGVDFYVNTPANNFGSYVKRKMIK